MEPGDDPGELDRYRQELDHYAESQSVVGITLAPTAPVTLTADGLLANLAKEVAQAHELRKDVAAQSGKTLTSEAAALVDVNIQYALRRAK